MKQCTIEGCDRPVVAKGWCRPHYNRAYRSGETGNWEIRAIFQKCQFPDCTETHYARGWCRFHHRQIKRGEPLRANRACSPKGSGHITPGGYRMIYVDGVRRQEHRVVMERMLGRELLPGENVHHKNGQRADNRPENLELWVSSQPPGQRPEDLVAWAHEILRRYEYLSAN